MNLSNKPTHQELSDILAACDDNAGHHVLWVSKSGDVQIETLINQSPIGFEESTPSLAMRYETFDRGNDYVGEAASKDEAHVTKLYDELVNNWLKYDGNSLIYIG